MTNKQAFRGGLTILAGLVACTLSISSAAAQQSKLRIIQTNSAGDNVHIIDAATNKVVGEIRGIEAPHGITVAPDGSRIYISEEAGDTLVVVDGKTMQEIKRIPLSGNPIGADIHQENFPARVLRTSRIQGSGSLVPASPSGLGGAVRFAKRPSLTIDRRPAV